MQKFGLDNSPSKKLSSIEAEIMSDQATALGIAGRKLEEAIQKHKASTKEAKSEEQSNQLIKDIADAAWGLLLQREFIGFVHDNIKCLKDSYDMSEEAIKLLGVSNTASEARSTIPSNNNRQK